MDEEIKKNDGGADVPAESGAVINEPSAAEIARDEYLLGWQRAKADFINYKKEEAARMEDISRYSNEALMKDFIDVTDDFDLALRAMEKSGGAEAVDKGIYMIRSKIEDALKKRGLEKIKISPGDAFDPAIAEAMLAVESDKPPGSVVEEVAPGYRLYEKVVRPARVIISKDHHE